MELLTGVTSAASALEAERVRMEVISQNMANANTTRGLDGKPYERQQVVFENVLRQQTGGPNSSVPATEVRVARIEKDHRPPRMIYAPGHPDADPASGMVAMPDINIYEEMADLITAGRAFEANLAVVKNARALALQTLAIGKRG